MAAKLLKIFVNSYKKGMYKKKIREKTIFFSFFVLIVNSLPYICVRKVQKSFYITTNNLLKL